MRVRLFAALCALFLALPSVAMADGPYGCPPWRPCGPGNPFGGNLWLPQRAFGADFRPACANHDACLAAGVPRAQCDRQFLQNMNCACESSRHPLLCRMQARWYYAGARVFGGLYY
ncbi:MAG: hypothetical protein U0996_02320 [Planctomycetaceae bacterium]